MSSQTMFATGKPVPDTAKLGKTSKDKPQIAVLMEVTEEGHELLGRQFIYRGYFSAAAMDYTMDALRLMGFTGNDLMDLSSIDQEVRLGIKKERYEGKDTYKVAIYEKNSGGGNLMKNEMSKHEQEAFAESMMGEFERFRQGKKGVASAVEEQPPPIDDSDIPF